MIFSLFLLLCLPGAAWLANRSRSGGDLPSALGEMAGLSIALNTLVWLSTAYFHIKLTAAVWVVFYGVCFVILIRGIIIHRHQIKMTPQVIYCLAGLLLILAFRFYQIRGLAFPAWVDSIQHATITNWLVSAGRVAAPTGYLPFFYYFGFHGLAAVVVTLTDIPVDQVLLVLGQVIGALIPFAIYRLGRVLFGDLKRSLGPALLVAFFSHMPAYYASWGRYTLLAGSLLLILAMAQFISLWRGKTNRGDVVLAAALTAGTWLTHYLAGIILTAFLVIIGGAALVSEIKQRSFSRDSWIRLVSGFGIGLLICLPWLIHAWQYARLEAGIQITLPGGPDSQSLATYAAYLWKLAGPSRNYVFGALGMVGLILSLIKPGLRWFAVWGSLLVIASLPVGVRFNPFRPDHILILLWLPFSLFAGDTLVRMAEGVARIIKWKHTTVLVYACLLVTLTGWGLRDTRSIVNPNTILADRWDKDAIRWMAELPGNPVVMINVTPWQSGIYRGVDGGYWLGLLTGSEIRPDLYLYTWQETRLHDQTQQQAERISQFASCDEGFYQYLDDQAITHIYIHTGTSGLQPDALAGCRGVSSLYNNGQVVIYQVEWENK